MKQFLTRGAMLTLKLFVAICLLIISGEIIVRYYPGKKANRTPATIFLGDSHIQNVYDDSSNLGVNSEAILFTYYKLKYILKYNEIDTVFLSLNPHSASGYYYEYFNRPAIIKRYFSYLPARLKWKLFYKINYPRVLFEDVTTVLSGESLVVGYYDKFRPDVTFDKQSCEERVRHQFEGHEFCTENIDYLDSINNLCSAKRIELILVKTPTHPYYFSGIPAKFRQKYSAIIKNYKVLDLGGLLTHDSLFLPDGEHVSPPGSVIATREINNFRQAGIKSD